MTNVGWQDAGIYLCQLAVHPPSLIWTRLDIDPPVVHILDSEEAPVWELHYDVGTTVEMVCRVKRPPLQGKHYFYLWKSGLGEREGTGGLGWAWVGMGGHRWVCDGNWVKFGPPGC